MDTKTYKMENSNEVQFSLIDFTPEELEKALAETQRSTPFRNSTPRQAESKGEMKNLADAVEALTATIAKRDATFAGQLDEVTQRLESIERGAVCATPMVDNPRSKVKFNSQREAADEDELMAALEEIERRAIPPHKEGVPKKPHMKPSQYDGRSSWEDYLAQFTIIADLNRWDSVTSATFLAVSLSGPAREVLGDLDPEERTSLPALMKALSTRFGTQNSRETYRTSLRTRTRQKNETLQELAQAIRRLTRQAYPQVPADVREDLAKDQFIDSLTDFDTKWKVKQARPATLNHALEVAVELEALQQATKTSPSTRAVQSKSSAENDLTQQLKELTEKLKKLEEKEQKRRDGCFHCGALDHFRRNCPTAPPRGRRKPQGEQQQHQVIQPTPTNSQKPSGNAILPGSRA